MPKTMDADDVNRLGRHVQRDIALVIAGIAIGIGIGGLMSFGLNPSTVIAFVVGAIALGGALKMKR